MNRSNGISPDDVLDATVYAAAEMRDSLVELDRAVARVKAALAELEELKAARDAAIPHA